MKLLVLGSSSKQGFVFGSLYKSMSGSGSLKPRGWVKG